MWGSVCVAASSGVFHLEQFCAEWNGMHPCLLVLSDSCGIVIYISEDDSEVVQALVIPRQLADEAGYGESDDAGGRCLQGVGRPEHALRR